MGTIKLETPLVELPGIGPRFSKYLKQLGITTVKNLLWHFPFRYEDFSQIYRIADLEPGQHATVQGTIEDIKLRRTWRRHMSIVEATIVDDSDSIRAVWFNQPYILNTLRTGRTANLSGKVSLGDHELYLSHPIYELIQPRRQWVGAPTKASEETYETRHTGRLVPIYPETRGLTSKGFRFLIQPLLKKLERLTEWIPTPILRAHKLPNINTALGAIHFPESIEEATAAKNRFAFEDLFLIQLFNLKQKLKLAEEKAPSIPTDIDHLKRILPLLPFELTPTQKRSLWEIIQDIGKPRPMNRLLQGDVGSGKTVVATLAALIAAINGYQTAFMAPTEVLARQHFETLKKLLSRIESIRDASPNKPAAGLLTSGSAEVFYGDGLGEKLSKIRLAEKIRTGEISIVIGTHALIEKRVGFKNLGLVIVDEQHRFGVRQRAELMKQEKSALIPHFLSMSATPIPRTLMLTIFGDLDISTITELPAGRKNIVTKIVSPTDREKAYQFIRTEVKKGRQAFVICPRIEPSDQSGLTPDQRELFKLEVKSVKDEYEKLSKNIFPDLRVAMLHGQMPAHSGRGLASGGKSTKTSVMNEFRDGKIDILVSTSVIEVGVDVPNATIMMIEGSDRFGLAQLYQFRGRVGRGEHQSFCFLFTDSNAKTTNLRLKAILEAKNGFELAEKDLKIRGPGEFLGETQTGLPDVAMRGLQNMELVKSSREAAVKILTTDRELKRYPLLREKLSTLQRELHLE